MRRLGTVKMADERRAARLEVAEALASIDGRDLAAQIIGDRGDDPKPPGSGISFAPRRGQSSSRANEVGTIRQNEMRVLLSDPKRMRGGSAFRICVRGLARQVWFRLRLWFEE